MNDHDDPILGPTEGPDPTLEDPTMHVRELEPLGTEREDSAPPRNH